MSRALRRPPGAKAAARLDSLCSELTANGLAFLHRCVDEFEDHPQELKHLSFAVVDLGVTIEVLLKARLVREHWTLICDDPDKATAQAMLAGDLFTVNPKQAVKRLDNIAGVPMTSSGHDKRVNDLMALRNRIVHFRPRPNDVPALQAALARGLDLVLWLLGTEFREEGDAATQQLVEESIELLGPQVGKLQGLVAERLTTIESTLANATHCLECPRCAQPALTLTEGETIGCAFCLWQPSGAEAAEEYVANLLQLSEYQVVKSGGTWPIHECLNCEEESLVEGVHQLRPAITAVTAGALRCDPPTEAHWACLACAYTAAAYEIDTCSTCGNIKASDDGSTVCSSCWHYAMAE